MCVQSICKCVHLCVSLNIVSRYPVRVNRLIDWCWFHLGSEQRLTEDLSRCERQPLILVLFKQHVLICVIFTKSAREECLPSYVWLFIEGWRWWSGGWGLLYNLSVIPTRHLHFRGSVPDNPPPSSIHECICDIFFAW